MPKKFTLFIIVLFSLICPKSYGQNLKLNISGQTSHETHIIDSLGYINEHPNLNLLKLEVDSTLIKLEKLGYFNVENFSINKKNDTLYNVSLKLGQRIKTIRVYLKGLADESEIRQLFNLKEEPFLEITPDQIKITLDSLTNQLAKKGDPFAIARLSEFNIVDKETLAANLILESSRSRTLDRIIVKGYEKFPESYIHHYLRLKEKQPFNLELIKTKYYRIDKLNFASKKRDPEVLFTNDSTILYIYVEKKPANNFDGFLGFGTDENSGKIQFDGLLNLSLTNNLNFGESFRLYYKSDENDQRTFNADLDVPYLFKLPIGINTGIRIFKRDTTFLNTEQHASIQYQIGASGKLLAGIDINKSDNLSEISNNNIKDYNATFFKVQYLNSGLEKELGLFPFRYNLDFAISAGKRKTELRSTDQLIFEWDAANNFYLNSKNIIYSRITGGYLMSDNYFINEQFRFGGINSIRGFKENSITADIYTVLNTEYRYKLSPSFYVHSILDLAYFEDNLNSIEENLLGFGLGFGIITQAGLLRLNYAGQKAQGQKISSSDFKIHLSLTAQF